MSTLQRSARRSTIKAQRRLLRPGNGNGKKLVGKSSDVGTLGVGHFLGIAYIQSFFGLFYVYTCVYAFKKDQQFLRRMLQLSWNCCVHNERSKSYSTTLLGDSGAAIIGDGNGFLRALC